MPFDWKRIIRSRYRDEEQQSPAADLAALPSTERVKNDLWTALAAAALVFLTLEWLVYHRRV